MVDRTKLLIIVAVVLIFVCSMLLYSNHVRTEALKEARIALNQTDYHCCDIYRNIMMPNMCANLRVEPFKFDLNQPTYPLLIP